MKKVYTPILSLLGMVFILGTAYGLDYWMDHSKIVAMAQFNSFLGWLLPSLIAELLFAGLVLAWLWYVYNQDSHNRIVALIFTMVGLGLLFYNCIPFAFAPNNLPMLLEIVPKSMSSFTCALIAVVGLQRLIFGKKEC
jgi:hypothetical protein